MLDLRIGHRFPVSRLDRLQLRGLHVPDGRFENSSLLIVASLDFLDCVPAGRSVLPCSFSLKAESSL